MSISPHDKDHPSARQRTGVGGTCAHLTWPQGVRRLQRVRRGHNNNFWRRWEYKKLLPTPSARQESSASSAVTGGLHPTSADHCSSKSNADKADQFRGVGTLNGPAGNSAGF